jgi:hypothetical protein
LVCAAKFRSALNAINALFHFRSVEVELQGH